MLDAVTLHYNGNNYYYCTSYFASSVYALILCILHSLCHVPQHNYAICLRQFCFIRGSRVHDDIIVDDVIMQSCQGYTEQP